ncbi:MAG: hypothetical protein ACOC1O_01600 [bacterium]
MSYHKYLIEIIKSYKKEDISNDILLDIYDKANEIKSRYSLRMGQSMMIALKGIDSNIYNEITGTDVDPFYDNKKIPKFEKAILNYLKK